MPTPEEQFQELYADLQQLAAYLHERGEKTLALSKRFEENARRDPSNREFDLNQARMLDYQHHVWNEMGALVEKLLKKYQHEM
ncbi:MAG TPA: hypothetical protein VKV19_00530 [Ktedonobacteraceae bacterium]|nr:hypothetical protein [Ktedonobacteraceae bacterium]